MKQRKFVFSFLILAFLSLYLTRPLIAYNCKSTISTTKTINDNNSLVRTLSSYNETLIKHNIIIKINQDNSLEITSIFVLANNDTKPMNFFIFTINKTIDSVFCFDLIDPLHFTWTVDSQIGNILNITLRYPLQENDIYAFSVSYKIKDIIFQIEGVLNYLELDFDVIHPRNTIKFNLEMELPIYAELLDEEPLKPYFPIPINVKEENNIIRIKWELTNQDTNHSNLFLVRYIPNANLSIDAASHQVLFILLSLFGGLILGAGTILLYFVLRKKGSEKHLVTSLLSKSEQEIIIAINLDGGVSTQRRICEKTGFSNSKVSKILTKLEEKKVLDRNRWGRTNKVTIKNQSFRKLGSENNIKDNESDLD